MQESFDRDGALAAAAELYCCASNIGSRWFLISYTMGNNGVWFNKILKLNYYNFFWNLQRAF